MAQVNEIFVKAREELRKTATDSVLANKKVSDTNAQKVVDAVKAIDIPKTDLKPVTGQIKTSGDDIVRAIQAQEVAEMVTIKNPEAITGDLKAGLEGIINTLKEELKNFDKNIVVKNDFSNFATLFKNSQDKKSIIDALKKIEDKLGDDEETDYTLILSDIATALENKDAVNVLKEILAKEYNVVFPSLMNVDLDPNLIENDRVKVVLRDDQVAQLSTTASANNLPLIDATKTGSTWLQQLGLDKDDATNYYFGFKQINTNLWRIKRIAKADYAVDWASGDSDADTAWTNRASQTYGNL